MDASVFIANKKVLWLWILAPLVVRFVTVFATYKLTAGYLHQYDQEKVYESVVETIQQEVTANDWVLQRFAQHKDALVNERFYQLIADRNAEYDVEMNAEVAIDRSKKAAAVKDVLKYEMNLKGNLPSVYIASAYLADLMIDPLSSMQSGQLQVVQSRGRGSVEQAVELLFEGKFVRLAMVPSAGGVK